MPDIVHVEKKYVLPRMLLKGRYRNSRLCNICYRIQYPIFPTFMDEKKRKCLTTLYRIPTRVNIVTAAVSKLTSFLTERLIADLFVGKIIDWVKWMVDDTHIQFATTKLILDNWSTNANKLAICRPSMPWSSAIRLTWRTNNWTCQRNPMMPHTKGEL